MKAFTLFTFTLLLLLCGCGATDEEPASSDPPGPWWELHVRVFEYIDPQPSEPPLIHGCPQIKWRIRGAEDSGEERCYHSTNELRIRQHMSRSLTVEYQVSCNGYDNTTWYPVYFDIADLFAADSTQTPKVMLTEVVYLRRCGC